MTHNTAASLTFEDVRIHVRVKLLALWSSLMFLYIYGDYFELYQPGKLGEMLAGRAALGIVSQGMLLGLSALMAIPSLMLCLCLFLPVRVIRWANVLLGAGYAVIVVLAIWGTWSYYMFLGLIEIAVSFIIVWLSWNWPRQPR